MHRGQFQPLEAPATISVPTDTARTVLIDDAVADVDAVTRAVEAEVGDSTSLSALDAIVAELDESASQRLDALPGVTVVEDSVVTLGADSLQVDAPWNLSRLDQAALPVDGGFTYPSTAGAGVRVYVVDSGITPNAEFGNRLVAGATAVSDGRGTSDCNGHGTHDAGSVGSTTWGVAKNATIVPVRVFDCSNTTSSTRVLSGLNWILSNHPAGVPGVINLSLSGDRAPDLDSAVSTASAAGFVVVVAAGNNNRDACLESPGAAPAAITVGAVNDQDARASFSNFGSCIDIFAPGWGIASVKSDGSPSPQYMSGTSMAAPHVAGTAALLWSANPGAAARAVETSLLSTARTGALISIGSGSPNRLVAVASASAPTPTPPASGAVAVYRFWSDEKQTHFYTSNVQERNGIIARYPARVWKYEGTAFGAFPSAAAGTVPVYRFWSDTGQSHFYTASRSERDVVIDTYPDNVWRYEGVAFHVYPASSSISDARPVARFWSPSYANHFYTASSKEARYVRSAYPASIWSYEGTAFRVPGATPVAAPLP